MISDIFSLAQKFQSKLTDINFKEKNLKTFSEKESDIRTKIFSEKDVTAKDKPPAFFIKDIYQKTLDKLIRIRILLAQDFQSLQEYFLSNKKEAVAFRTFFTKFSDIVSSEKEYYDSSSENLSIDRLVSFIRDVIDLLNKESGLNLFDPVNNKVLKTNFENLDHIYYDSYSFFLQKHQELGLSGSKIFKPIKLRGIKEILAFEEWFVQNKNMFKW